VAHAEASARTVEAAVTAAAAQLGLRSDQVDVKVLEDPVPSTFGFIGSPARVRVTPRTSSNTPAASGSGGSTPAGAASAGSIGSGSAGSGSTEPTDSGSAVSGPAGSGPAGQPAHPHSHEAPQVLDPAQTHNLAQAPELDQAAQPAQAAASTAPADLGQDSEQPTPVAAEGDQPPAAVAVQGERPSGSTSGAGDPASSIGTPATGPAATAASGSDGAPSATMPSIATRPSRRTYRDEPIEPAMVEADTERAGDFLEGLLDALDVDGDITTWVDEVGGHIDLEGSDLDMLVGSNGETLDALQELTRLAVLRQSKRRVRLLLDINGFRARQRERLVSVVRATAEQVIKSQEDHEFQPMTPAERKIVHDAVAAIDGVTTESLGEEPNRRVIIQPT
jgi:spoIIIJ-associated protein